MSDDTITLTWSDATPIDVTERDIHPSDIDPRRDFYFLLTFEEGRALGLHPGSRVALTRDEWIRVGGWTLGLRNVAIATGTVDWITERANGWWVLITDIEAV